MKLISDKKLDALFDLLSDNLTIKECKALIANNDLRKAESSSMTHYSPLKEDFIGVITDLLTDYKFNRLVQRNVLFTTKEMIEKNLNILDRDLLNKIFFLFFGEDMVIDEKLELIKAVTGEEVQRIETNTFNGIWFNVAGFEVIALTNEELFYANNNIVSGDIYETFPDYEQHDKITLFSVQG